MALIALSWLRYCNLDVLEHMLGQMQQYLQTGSTVTSYQAICVIRSFCFFIPDTFLSALVARVIVGSTLQYSPVSSQL